MKSSFLAFSLALVVVATGSSARAACTQTWSGVNYFYAPEPIDSLTGRYYTLEYLRTNPSAAPLRTMHFMSGNLGTSVFANAISWAVGNFTGLYPSAPLTQRQRGNTNYGGNAIQVQAAGGQMGWMLNSFGLPRSINPDDQFVNLMARYLIPYRTRYPWLRSTSRLGMEFSIQVPDAFTTTYGHQYITAQLAIHDGTDASNTRYFWMQPLVFAKGFGTTVGDSVGFDVGTNTYFINPVYGTACGSRYSSRYDNPAYGQYSAATVLNTPYTGWKWYSLLLTRQNLLNAITDINAKITAYNSDARNTVKKPLFSTDPSKYFISYMGVQSEINRQNGQDGHIGLSMKNLYLYELY